MARIKIHGYSGTKIPAYHVSLEGTGKKFSNESKKKKMVRMRRIIAVQLGLYIRINYLIGLAVETNLKESFLI